MMNGMDTEREIPGGIAILKALVKPRSIAVIGASRRAGTIGNKMFLNILQQQFDGVVYPVNPNVEVVASVRAYPSVLDIPGELDLAIIAVPATVVPSVLEQCGQKGVRCAIVITSGFGEIDADGQARQEELVNLAHSHGMRLLGPNCMGVINTDPQVSMNATFSSVFPPAGSIAMGSQSGALGLAILEYAESLNIGLSTFVSLGNRADISSNDLLEYWRDDPATEVILLYLESFGNPRRFARMARKITKNKPIVAMKSGRTPAGSRAAASHTGALATTELASEALFTQAGIIRVDTLEELFDVANLLSHQPVPSGNKVAILTNGGGPGILTADACAARGLEIPPLSEETVSRLKELLPDRASFTNPIDMTAEASARQYGEALRYLLEDEDIDMVIVIFIPPIVTGPEEIAAVIRNLAPRFYQQGKTLVASLMGWRGANKELSSGKIHVPGFSFPESTAVALARAYEYGQWVKRPEGVIPGLMDIDRDKARKLVEFALQRSDNQPTWLDADSVNTVLECYGVSMAQSGLADTKERAGDLAERLGFPVAAKLLSDTIVHKTEVGGVVLELRTRAEVEEAYEQIRSRLVDIGREGEMKGVTLQQMVEEGVEVIVGVTQSPNLGPLMLFGLGGIYTELFKDVAFRIHPLTDIDAREMIESIRAYRLLEGWRGAKPCDVSALEELLLRISAMVEDLPQIAEMDLNPVKALNKGSGYKVLDARIRLAWASSALS